MFFVNGNLMSELVKIDENILDIMKDIVKLNENDYEDRALLYDYLNMFVKKEKRLLSKIPRDKSFINFFMNNLDNFVVNSVSNPDNAGKIISRISSFFNVTYFDIKPTDRFSTVVVDDKIIQYDLLDEYNQNKLSYYYHKNLIVRYLKYLEDMKMLGIYDESELLTIQFLNIFFFNDLNEELCENGYNLSKLLSVTDDDFIKENSLSSEEFSEMKKNVIFSNISVLLNIFFSNKNDDIDRKDAEFNFKFLLSELSYDELIDLLNELDNKFQSIIESSDEKQIELISIIDTYVNEEIERRKNDNNVIDYENMNDEEHEKLLNLVNFEKNFLSVFESFDFDSNEINNLSKMQELEDELVSNINFDNVSVSDFSVFVNEELPHLVSKNDLFLIQNRFGYLFPEYKSLFMSPSQSSVSNELIFRNYVVDTLRIYYDLISSINNDFIYKTYFSTYKNRFFMYPFLTKELIAFGGNHLMVESVSDEMVMDVADITNIEYSYDINEQLFSEACSIVSEFTNIDSGYSAAYFQLMFIQFDYIIRIIDSDMLESLIDYINSLNISFKNVLFEMIDNNLSDKDYSFQIFYDNEGVKVKVFDI